MEFSKISKVKSPERGTLLSAGIDFFIPDDYPGRWLEVKPRSAIKIPSGLQIKIPVGSVLILKDKSSIAVMGLKVGACVIDADYTGEIHFHLFNMTDATIILRPGMKITQGVLMPVYMNPIVERPFLHLAENLEAKMQKRGAGGFGSTGNGLGDIACSDPDDSLIQG